MLPADLSAEAQNRIKKTFLDASAMTRAVQRELNVDTSWRKTDRSPVTIADLAVQILILRLLAELAPGEEVFAEEEVRSLDVEMHASGVRELIEQQLGRTVSQGELRDTISYRGEPGSARTWLLDPIDGTKGYVRGQGYAMTLATLEQGRVTRSWMAVPSDEGLVAGVTGNLFTAVLGEGAKRMSISSGAVDSLHLDDNQPVDGGELVIAATRAHENVDLPQALDQDRWPIKLLPLDSIAKYAALATGKAHLYPRKPSQWIGPFYCWDHAAGVLLLEEAGGVVTDLAGKKLDWSQRVRLTGNRGIFAASHLGLHSRFQPLFANHVRDMLQ